MRITGQAFILFSVIMPILILLFCGVGSGAQARFLAIPRTAGLRTHHGVVKVKKKSSRAHKVTQYAGSKRTVVEVRHHGRHHRRSKHEVTTSRVRHAYPLNFFMLRAPDFDKSPLSPELSHLVRTSFDKGTADRFPPRSLVRAGIATYYPLHGGIFWRREPVKFIIVHSTETGVPQDAKRVIDSWGSAGRRHAGAQYVVDRDGTIYQAVDPDLATVHVNIFKTLPGINNDNSVGIEMVHAGRQSYTPEQRSSVIRLVTYLQGRYQVTGANIITHRYAQQGDHTDPVAFDWEAFLQTQSQFRNQSLAWQIEQINKEAQTTWVTDWPVASTYLQIHRQLPVPAETPSLKSTSKPVKSSPVTSAPTTTSLPALRGPIEIDPKAASFINSVPPVTAKAEISPRTAGSAQAVPAKTGETALPDDIEMFIH